MKVRILTWLFIGNLAIGVSYATPKQPKPPKPRYHCVCGDICAKTASHEQCMVKRCDGKDLRRTRERETSPD